MIDDRIPETADLKLPKMHALADLGAELHADISAGEFTIGDYCSWVNDEFNYQALTIKSSKDKSLLPWDHWSLALNKYWIERCADNLNDTEYQASLVFWWTKNEHLKMVANEPHRQGRMKRLRKDSQRLFNVAVGMEVANAGGQLQINIATQFQIMYNNLLEYYRKVAESEDEDAADDPGSAGSEEGSQSTPDQADNG